MPPIIDTSRIRLSDRAFQYFKGMVERSGDISDPDSLKHFPTIKFCNAMYWIAFDGTRQKLRENFYEFGKLDISNVSIGYLFPLAKNQYVAFLPEPVTPTPERYFIDVTDDVIEVYPS